MFIAMNRFRVALGQEEAFESIWENRESRLLEMDGFLEFKLLRGPKEPDAALYASYAVWLSRDHFDGWTRSPAFQQSHRNEGGLHGVVLGHPIFEGFEVLQCLDKS